MSCNTLNGLPFGCTDDIGIGGIYRALVFDMLDINTETLNDTTGFVTALAVDVAAKEYTFKRNTAFHTTTPNIDLINGSTFFTHVVSLMFGKRKASKSVELQIMGEGQRYLGMVYQDANKLWWYVKDLQLSGGEESTGQAKPDNSKYNVEFTGEWEKRAYEISESDALALLIQAS